LYIDILFISLDGNALDAAWASVPAALSDTSLLHAYWDIDTSRVLYSSSASQAGRLRVAMPVDSVHSGGIH